MVKSRERWKTPSKEQTEAPLPCWHSGLTALCLCHPRDSHLEPALSEPASFSCKAPPSAAQAWRQLAQASVLTCSIPRPASVQQSLSSHTTQLPYVWGSSSSATPSASSLFLQLPGLAPGPQEQTKPVSCSLGGAPATHTLPPTPRPSGLLAGPVQPGREQD